MVFLNHGGGSFDHIQKSVIFIMIRYLFRLHFHFALSILKMIRRTVPAIPSSQPPLVLEACQRLLLMMDMKGERQ